MLLKFNFISSLLGSKSIHNKVITAILAASMGLAVLAPVPLTAQNTSKSIRLENDSSFSIYNVFVSPVTLGTWGNDKLGSIVLDPGYYVTLPPLPFGHYDLKLVDEDGDTCVVSDVQIGGNTSWSITDSWLLGCEFHR